jgi:sugar lactone lactonase YvrE
MTIMGMFARIDGRADGMAVDSMGRVYVAVEDYPFYSPLVHAASGPGEVVEGVQVFGTDGSHLGTTPTPGPVVSVAFSGSGKKWLYAQGRRFVGPNGKEMTMPYGPVNDTKSIYKIEITSEGYEGRPN